MCILCVCVCVGCVVRTVYVHEPVVRGEGWGAWVVDVDCVQGAVRRVGGAGGEGVGASSTGGWRGVHSFFLA